MNEFWSVPKMWPGETCVILASGPSMNADIADAVRKSGYRTIAVCRTFELVPFADMVYAADAMWWGVHYQDVKAKCPNAICAACEGIPTVHKVRRLRIGAMDGFNADPGTVNTGGNSGYQAICIAAHAGCARILLCGFDMHGAHWHKDYKHPLRNHSRDTFEGWLRRFDTLKEPLSKLGIEVINCTPGSALKTWCYLDLENALIKQKVAA